MSEQLFSSIPFLDLSKLPDSNTKTLFYMQGDPAVIAEREFARSLHAQKPETSIGEITDILHDFLGQDLPFAAYKAAVLSEVILRKRDTIYSQNVKRALALYDELEKDPDSSCYVFSVLSDLPLIRDAEEKQRATFAAALSPDDQEFAVALTDRGYRKKLPQEFWLRKSGTADFRAIGQLFEVTDLTSGLIMAAKMMQSISKVYRSGNEARTLRYVHAIESFYAPFVESLGYDGFAMALRDKAASVRFEMSEEAGLLEEARNLVGPIRNMSTVHAVSTQMFGEHRYTITNVIGNRSGVHDVLVGDTAADISGEVVAGAWRVKSDGSTADKLRNKMRSPRDLLAETFIAPDHLAAIAFFGCVLDIVDADNGVSLNRSHGRRGIKIAGPAYHNDAFRNVLEDRGVDVDEVVEVELRDKKQFQMAKYLLSVTIGGMVVPVELRVTDKEYREEERRGPLSHMAYKNGGSDVAVFRTLYRRKQHIQPDRLAWNPSSLLRGEALRQDARQARRRHT